MAAIEFKYRFLRHLIVSIALLLAVLFRGTAAYACDSTMVNAKVSAPAKIQDQVSNKSSNNDHSLQYGKIYLAEEGTESSRTNNLQPVARTTKPDTITFNSQLAVPLYMARAPGDCFFCLFFYTSSQPQAP